MLGLCTLPECEVRRITFLLLTVKFTCRIEHIIKITAGQYTVVMVLVILCNVEVNRALALVSITVVKNLLHKLNLLDDVAGSMRLDARGKHIKGIHNLVIVECVLLHHFHRLNLLKTCFLCNLVLTLVGIMFKVTDICDVTHVTYLVTEVLQITEQHIECYRRTCMTQMCRTVDSGTAHIKSHVGCMQRLEQLFLTRKSIVYHKLVFHII